MCSPSFLKRAASYGMLPDILAASKQPGVAQVGNMFSWWYHTWWERFMKRALGDVRGRFGKHQYKKTTWSVSLLRLFSHERWSFSLRECDPFIRNRNVWRWMARQQCVEN
jgi:hypothetical protein